MVKLLIEQGVDVKSDAGGRALTSVRNHSLVHCDIYERTLGPDKPVESVLKTTCELEIEDEGRLLQLLQCSRQVTGRHAHNQIH